MAENELSITTHDLHVKSSVDTATSTQDTKDLSGTLSMTMYGGGSGLGASVGYGEGHSTSDSTTNTNSNLIAKNIDIETSNDASFKGATVKADDTLNLKVGGALSVESQRDSSSSNSNGFNVSASASLGSDKDYTSGSKAQQSTLNQTVGARTGDGLGSAGASYGASTGTSQTKQTVLTSLTGDKVNIEVENNTNIKGALIAAGKTDEQGTFQDNGNLNLSTGTLTFANSTNSQYSSSNSYSVGTNIGFGSKTNTQTNVEETTGKVNSSSLSLSNEMGYSSSKTLATVGEGTLHVKDTENSDDLTRLNRDTSKVNKDLYSGSVGTSVTATLDHRLLTEDGRKQIAEDIERTKRLGEAIGDVATKESIELKDTFNHIGDVNTDLDVQKEFALKEGGKYVAILDDKTRSLYTQEQRDEALNAYAQVYAYQYGVSIESAKSATLSKFGSTYTNSTNTNSNIYVDNQSNQGALDTANTMGHEVAHVRMNEGQTRPRETKELQEEYADTFGKYSADGMEFSSETYNNTKLNTTKVAQDEIKKPSVADAKTLADNTKAYEADAKKADNKDGRMDDSLIPGADYIRWVALGGSVPLKELIKQELAQDERIMQLSKEKLAKQGKEAVEMAKNLPETLSFLMDHPEKIKEMPEYIQHAIVEYMQKFANNMGDIGNGLVTNNPKAIEAQAQAESDLVVDLTTTLIGYGVGKVAVSGGKIIVEGIGKITDKVADAATKVLDDAAESYKRPTGSGEAGKSIVEESLVIAKQLEIEKAYSAAKRTDFIDNNGRWIYPDNTKNLDAIPGTLKDTGVQKGDILVRYVEKSKSSGYSLATDDGSYVTKPGQSWESLSLPGKKEDYVAYKIEVLEDIPVKESLATPWFNQPGGGVQNQFGKSIRELSDAETGVKLKLLGVIK